MLIDPKRSPREGVYAGEGIWSPTEDGQSAYRVEETREFRSLLETLCEEIGKSSHAIYAEFDIGAEGGRWDLLAEEGYICFTRADGRKCYASYGVAGSWAEHNDSWLWSWAMPRGWVHPNAQLVGKRAHLAGLNNDWPALTIEKLLVNEHEAWHLTKLAAHLSDMPMVYRAMVNDINWHYFALGRPVWAN